MDSSLSSPSAPTSASAALQPDAQWHNGFASLPPVFYTRLQPTPMPDLAMHACNETLAKEMGLRTDWLASAEATQVLGGNGLLPGIDPLASVYSGHQFGHWAGQLGDGRAILLGEITSGTSPQGLELQLKGAGKTPYSRMGDGRAVLRSSIREYLCSEAMQGLGVPTTRALSLVTSPQPIYRETVETAAVVARVAPSFVRFGHFEHFAAKDDIGSLRRLADYVAERYIPQAATHASGSAERYAALLGEVAERTAGMIALWQAHGFCHGVMNTDNMSILGLTIDYGPFQFLDHYDANHICNHSDTGGRYAFARQPQVAYWNLFCLGQALLPLIEDESSTLAALERYKTALEPAMQRALGAKLGLDPAHSHAPEAVAGLVNPLLALMQQHRTDYSLFWRALSQAVADDSLPALAHWFNGDTGFETWREQYQALRQPGERAASAARMFAANPRFVLRNHLGQEAITAAQQGNWTPFHRLQTVLATPYAEHPGCEDLASLPPDWAQHIEISCSS